MLHFGEFPEQEISGQQAEDMLRETSGGYNKSKVYNLPIQMDLVQLAVSRAKTRFNTVEDLWNQNGSNVFQIVETLLSRSASISERGDASNEHRVRPRPVRAG